MLHKEAPKQVREAQHFWQPPPVPTSFTPKPEGGSVQSRTAAYPGVHEVVRSRLPFAEPSYQAMLYRFRGPRKTTETSSNGTRSPLTHTCCDLQPGNNPMGRKTCQGLSLVKGAKNWYISVRSTSWQACFRVLFNRGTRGGGGGHAHVDFVTENCIVLHQECRVIRSRTTF